MPRKSKSTSKRTTPWLSRASSKSVSEQQAAGSVLGAQKPMIKALAIAIARVSDSMAKGIPIEEVPDPRPVPDWSVSRALNVMAQGGIDAAVERTHLLAEGKSLNSSEGKDFEFYNAVAELVGVPTACKKATCKTRRTCRTGRRAAPAFCDPLRPKRIQLATGEWGWSGANTVIAFDTKEGAQEIPAKYALIPNSALKTSHDPLNKFSKTKGYPDSQALDVFVDSEEGRSWVRLSADQSRFRPGLLISSNLNLMVGGPPVVDRSGHVLSGNRSMMSAKTAMSRDGMSEYSQYLARELGCNTCYGLSDADASGMVLVRMVESGWWDFLRNSAFVSDPKEITREKMRMNLSYVGDITVHSDQYFIVCNHPGGCHVEILSLDDGTRERFGVGAGWDKKRAVDEAVMRAFGPETSHSPKLPTRKSEPERPRRLAEGDDAKERSVEPTPAPVVEKPKKKKSKFPECNRLAKKIAKLESKRESLNKQVEKAKEKIPELQKTFDAETDIAKRKSIDARLRKLEEQRAKAGDIHPLMDELSSLQDEFKQKCQEAAEKTGKPVEKIEASIQREIRAEEKAREGEREEKVVDEEKPVITIPPIAEQREPSRFEDRFEDPSLWSGGAREARYPRGDDKERERRELEEMLRSVEDEETPETRRREVEMHEGLGETLIYDRHPETRMVERPASFVLPEGEGVLQGRAHISESESEEEKKQRLKFEGKYAIDPSDPHVIEKIERKISKLETLDGAMREANKILAKKRLTESAKIEELSKLGIKEKTAKQALTPDSDGNLGFSKDMIKANRNSISRLQRRLEAIKELRSKMTMTVEYEGVQVVDNADTGLIGLYFDEAPSAKVRSFLKQKKFKVAKTVEGKPFQRKRSDRSRKDLELIVSELGLQKVLYKDEGKSAGILVGGVGDAVPTEVLDPVQLSIGIGVELEHTDDIAAAAEIATDHFVEHRDYYTKLRGIEGASKGILGLSYWDLARLIFLVYRQVDRDEAVAMNLAIAETGIFEGAWRETRKTSIADGLANDKKVLAKGIKWIDRISEASKLPKSIQEAAKRKGKIVGHYLWVHPFSRGAMGVEAYDAKKSAILSRQGKGSPIPNLPGFLLEPTVWIDIDLELSRALVSPCISTPGQTAEEVAREQDPEGYSRMENKGYRACWEDDCGSYEQLDRDERRKIEDRWPRSADSAKNCGYSFRRSQNVPRERENRLRDTEVKSLQELRRERESRKAARESATRILTPQEMGRRPRV